MMKRVAATWAVGSLVIVACSGTKSGPPEPVARARSAISLLTEEIDGTVTFSEPAGSAATAILNNIGVCGGVVVAHTQGTSDGGQPPPTGDATTALSGVAVDHLSASYQLTVDAPVDGCPDSYTDTMRVDVSTCLAFGSYNVAGPTVGICQNAGDAGLPPLVENITDCAGVVEVDFTSPVTGGTMEAFHPAFPGGAPQSRADYGPPSGQTTLSAFQLPVHGDGSQVKINAYFTSGTDDFSDRVRRLCQFTGVTVNCGDVVHLTCGSNSDAGTGAGDGGCNSDLGAITGNVDVVGEFENPIASDRRTLVWGFIGPLGNERFFQVPANPSPATESPDGGFAGESSGTFILQNLLNSNAQIPATGSPQPWPVFADMSLRNGRRSEYFSSPRLDQASDPNAAVTVPACTTVNLDDTFVMHPGYVDGNILLAGPRTPNSCLKDIMRASDGLPANAVPADWSLGGSSFVLATGVNSLAGSATHTTVDGVARVLFDGDFNPLTTLFLGPSVSYELVLGNLGPGVQQGIWSVNGMQLRFRDAQALAFETMGTAPPATPNLFQESTIFIAENPPATFTVPPSPMIKDLHYCFGELVINYQNIGQSSGSSGAFFSPQLTAAGAFAGTDFEGKMKNYTVSSQSPALGTAVNQATASTTGEVVQCLPQGTYNFSPSVTTINTNSTTSNTPLPQISGISINCGDNVVVTPPLAVTETVPACASSTTVPVTAIAISSNTSLPNIPVNNLEVLASTPLAADAGADAGSPPPTDLGTMCTGVDAGAAGSCGGGSPGACGCTPTGSLTKSVTLPHSCLNNVTVTATSVDESGTTLVSSDTSTVLVDPTTLSIACPTSVTKTLATGQSSVAVTYPAPLVNDACPQNVSVTCTPPSGTVFAATEGAVPATCTATTTNGNTVCQAKTCNFTITVNPPPKCPGIPCPALADAVLADTGSMTDNAGTLVDSYHSGAGAYGGTNRGNAGNVRTATTVVNNGGTIHGSETQHSPAGLSPIPVPTCEPVTNLHDLNINGPGAYTLNAGAYVVNNLNLNGGSIVVNGAVRLWVTGSININRPVNLGGRPGNLQIVLTSTANLFLNSGGVIYGQIYAPASTLYLNGPVFGSVVGSSVTLNSGAAVHFDQDSVCSGP